jgi:hypothetical protein
MTVYVRLDEKSIKRSIKYARSKGVADTDHIQFKHQLQQMEADYTRV